MANPRGIFTLRNLVLQEKLGEAVPVSDVYIKAPDDPLETNASNVWTMGGSAPRVSLVEKISFSDDTRSSVPGADIPGPTKNGMGSISGGTGAYALGGRDASSNYYSNSFKISYSDETTAASPGMELMAAMGYGAGLNASPSTAYYFGSAGPGALSHIQKASLSTEMIYNLGLNLPPAGSFLNAAAGNSTKGFVIGGYPSENRIEKIEYATDTLTGSTMPAPIYPYRSYGLAASVGDNDAGYFSGGQTPGGTVSWFLRMTYATETIEYTPATNLVEARDRHGGSGQPSHGYFVGGGPSPYLSSTEKLVISTETCGTSPTAQLSSERELMGVTSPLNNTQTGRVSFPLKQFKTALPTGPNAGYAIGGAPSGVSVSLIERTNFSSDTTNLVSPLTANRTAAAAAGTTGEGYITGGYPGPLSSFDKLTYSTDTTAAFPSAELSVARNNLGATGNETEGYFGGGTPGTHQTMDKFVYAAGTVAAAPGANLSAGRYSVSASGNSDNGYFFGGQVPAATSIVDKITYATTSSTTIPGLTSAKRNINVIGNSEVGYLMGGYNPGGGLVECEKCTYLTDSTELVPSGNLYSACHSAGTSGNHTSGYVMGGAQPPNINSIQKVDYTTETTSLTPATLSSANSLLTGVGPRDNGLPFVADPTPTAQTAFVASGVPTPGFGYVMGGHSGSPLPVRSTISKMTYSDETMSTLPSSMSGARYGGMAVSTASNAYSKGGGYNFSFTDRLNYSTATTTLLPACTEGAPYNERRFPKTTMDKSRGYAIGGSVPGINGTSACFLTFATETCETKTDAAIFDNADGYGIGDLTRGYYAGHQGPGNNPSTNLMKLVYSTDLFSAVPGGITHARSWTTAVGDDTNGYFYGYIVPTGFSFIDKLVFSTETNSVITASTVAPDQWHAAGYSSTTVGYISQGFNPSTAPDYYYTNTSKLTFSDETTAAVPGGDALYTAYGSMGTSAQGYGVGASSSGNTPVIC